jgi:hypothetical protein
VTFGSSGSGTIGVASGADIHAATFSSSGAQIELFYETTGTVTMSANQYNQFASITDGTAATNGITFSSSGIMTDKADVTLYNFASGGGTVFTVSHNAADVITSTTNNDDDTVDIGSGVHFTGSVAFGSNGTIGVASGADIHQATITPTGTLELHFNDGGSADTATMSISQYNGFGTVVAGTVSDDGVAFSNAGSITDNANIGKYNLFSAGGSDFTVTHNASDVVNSTGNGDTVDLGTVAFTGALNFGSSGADTITATIGGDLSGGSFSQTGAAVTLVLSADGTETLTASEYNALAAITFTGSAGASNDTITFADAGTMTDMSTVGVYNLSSAGGTTFNVSNATDQVNSTAGGDVINIGAITFTGGVSLGTSIADTLGVTDTTNISGASITSDSNLVFNSAGTVTMTVEQYNGFGSITHSASGTDAVTFSDTGSGPVTDTGSIDTYNLTSSGGTTFDIANNTAATVSSTGGNDAVNVGTITYTGHVTFGSNAATDTLGVSSGTDIHGATIDTGSALVFNSSGDVIMTTEQYNGFTGITGGTASTNALTFSDAGTVTDSAQVTHYSLASAGGSVFNVANNAADAISSSTSTTGDTVNVGAVTFTGSMSFGTSLSDAISLAGGADISGASSFTSSASALNLSITGSSPTVTVTAAQADLFHDGAPISASANATMNIADNSNVINLTSQENAIATIGLNVSGNTVDVSVGAQSSSTSGFNQTISENGGGSNNYFVDNGSATILGASDNTHFVSISNFNASTDILNLTLGGAEQNGTQQAITAAGTALTASAAGGVLFISTADINASSLYSATDLADNMSVMQQAVDGSSEFTGECTVVMDTTNGAAIYEVNDLPSGTIDGIQLIGVLHGVAAANLVSHVGHV